MLPSYVLYVLAGERAMNMDVWTSGNGRRAIESYVLYVLARERCGRRPSHRCVRHEAGGLVGAALGRWCDMTASTARQ